MVLVVSLICNVITIAILLGVRLDHRVFARQWDWILDVRDYFFEVPSGDLAAEEINEDENSERWTTSRRRRHVEVSEAAKRYGKHGRDSDWKREEDICGPETADEHDDWTVPSKDELREQVARGNISELQATIFALRRANYQQDWKLHEAEKKKVIWRAGCCTCCTRRRRCGGTRTLRLKEDRCPSTGKYPEARRDSELKKERSPMSNRG